MEYTVFRMGCVVLHTCFSKHSAACAYDLPIFFVNSAGKNFLSDQALNYERKFQDTRGFLFVNYSTCFVNGVNYLV